MDREWQKGTCGSHFQLRKKKQKNKTNKQNKKLLSVQTDRDGGEILIFSLLNLLSSILEFLIVGFRWAKNEKRYTRRGLRVGTKNTGFHREFR